MKFDLEKMKECAINCSTEEKARQLLEFLKSQGFKWSGDDTNWGVHEDETCYEIKNNKIYYSKYDYYFEQGYTILEFEDVVIPDKLRICEILGVEIEENFNIKNGRCNPYRLVDTGYELHLFNSNDIYSDGRLINLINNPELIEKIPEWTVKQKYTFTALKDLFHLKYITKDFNGIICGFQNKPKRRQNIWGSVDAKFMILRDLDEDIFEFLKWEAEPFEIPTVE